MKPGTYLRVVGDENDGDYIEEWTNIDTFSDASKISIIEELHKLKGEDLHSIEIPDILQGVLPNNQYEGVHSLESVELVVITACVRMV